MRDKDGDEETTEDIAAELGLSPQRVLQIQATALRRCRDWCKARGYRLEDLLPDTPSKIRMGFGILLSGRP